MTWRLEYLSGTYRSGPLLSGTDTVALYCRGRGQAPRAIKHTDVNQVSRPIGRARLWVWPTRESGGQAATQVGGTSRSGIWELAKNEQKNTKQKNREKGRGSGRGIHFLIGNTFSVTFNSHSVGGEWRTGEEQIMRIYTRPNRPNTT